MASIVKKKTGRKEEKEKEMGKKKTATFKDFSGETVFPKLKIWNYINRQKGALIEYLSGTTI